MDNIEIVRIVLAINGEYISESKKFNIDEFDELKEKLSKPSYLKKVIDLYLNKNNISVYNKKLTPLCGNCAKFLCCPKVKDSEKKSLKKYPFIKLGAQMIFIDKNKKLKYDSALIEYKKRLNMGDEKVNDDEILNKILLDNGVEISTFCVFECVNFVDEKKEEEDRRLADQKIIKKPKKFQLDNKDEKKQYKFPNFSKYFDF